MTSAVEPLETNHRHNSSCRLSDDRTNVVAAAWQRDSSPVNQNQPMKHKLYLLTAASIAALACCTSTTALAEPKASPSPSGKASPAAKSSPAASTAESTTTTTTAASDK